MSNDKMQEEFEQAIAVESGEPITAIFLSRKDDTYATSTLKFAWWAWKASRKSLVIELPCSWYEERQHLMDADDVLESINAAGLNVK